MQLPMKYTTALHLIKKDAEVKLLKKYDEKRIVEAEKGKLSAIDKAKPRGKKMTELIATADAGGEKGEDKKLALKVVKKICDELGVTHMVNEK